VNTFFDPAVLPLGFLNFGMQEIVVIFLIIVLLFGAKKLPELARGLGKSVGEFKKARGEFERELNSALHDENEKAKQPQDPAKPSDPKA
jgi:sec-independent protein translocase protein TatA